MAAPISETPEIAALVAVAPSRMCRSMFSVTTMESSTNRPSEMINPEMLIWLRE